MGKGFLAPVPENSQQIHQFFGFFAIQFSRLFPFSSDNNEALTDLYEESLVYGNQSSFLQKDVFPYRILSLAGF